MELVCSVWIAEQTAKFALQNTERLVFITEVESVYCAVRTQFLYNIDTFRFKRFNSALDREKWSELRPGRFIPGTHWKGGSVSPINQCFSTAGPRPGIGPRPGG